MRDESGSSKLVLEEKKAIKLFLWLFYIFYFAFELVYYYLDPLFTKKGKIGFPHEGLGIWLYVLVLGLLVPGIYIYKKGNPYVIKYLYVVGYVIFTMIDNLITYWGNSKPFASGSIVEVLFIVFSPIFINKKYFFVSSSLVIGKFVLLGLILQDSNTIPPIIIYLIIVAIASIVLLRFYSYIGSLKKVYEDLRQKEKLALVGQMAAAVGHEIRNPLSSLKGFTQLQKERYPDTNEFYPIMIQEIDRINLIVNDLMYLGQPKNIHFSKEGIEEIIAYTLSITQQQAQRQKVIVETIMEGPLPPIDCDGKQLKQVFINMIKNSIEAMPAGGKLKINVKVFGENKLLISIQDEGCGIPEEDIPNLGEPFYTTKKDGTGLGLMVTKQIIKEHNGEIKIESILGKGTVMKVVLPIIQL
ncbi:MAG: ATP-binding protein [Bacillota bacterium]|nr:ATP-binding protein [Bacillota bacterium]